MARNVNTLQDRKELDRNGLLFIVGCVLFVIALWPAAVLGDHWYAWLGVAAWWGLLFFIDRRWLRPMRRAQKERQLDADARKLVETRERAAEVRRRADAMQAQRRKP